MRNRLRAVTVAAGVALGLAALLPAFGCAGGGAGGRADASENVSDPGAPPASMTMTGTLRDLEPAISYACGQHEMAILDKPKPSPDTPNVRVFDIITVVDEPVTLTITLPENAPGFDAPNPTPGLAAKLMPSSAPIQITAQIRIAFGYPEREHAFLSTLRDRLSALEEGHGIAKGKD